MSKNKKAKKFIDDINEIGILFRSDSIIDDVNEHNEFRTAINIDVSSHITKNDPYALAIMTNYDSSTYLSIIKRKMGLSGGGIVISSYEICELLGKYDIKIPEEEFDENNCAVLKKLYFKKLINHIYSEQSDDECLINLLIKYQNLSNPTFTNTGNLLYADDAENMSERIFEDSYDPVNAPIFKINEDDLIYHDLYSEENGKLKYKKPGHIRYITESERLLDVINVNRKLAEKALGVDLIYHIREFRLIAMVQYKRIDRGVYYTSSDRNYAKEIQRMEKNLHKFKIPDDIEDHIAHKFFRLQSDPFYFKLCPDSSLTKNKYVSGACLPFDQWNRLMKSDFCQTKSGSKKIEYGDLQNRYLKSSEFISLVKRGMLGGYIKDLKQLANIINELSDRQHIVVAAIESPGRDYIDQ